MSTLHDGIGFAGIVTQYAMALFFTLGALALFIYCRVCRQHAFDEDPKQEMLHDDDR